MTPVRGRALNILAPAKINLYLHITGRRNDGYHILDSLVAFADIGDQVCLEPSAEFRFDIRGPFAGSFGAAEKDASPDSSNLAVQAAWALARSVRRNPDVRVTLTKALPLGAGLGGGSSDAAAVLWGLSQWWGLPQNPPWLADLMLSLGADVPACMLCRPVRVQGVGEILMPAPAFPEIPLLLVHPGRPCATPKVFARYDRPFAAPPSMPECFGNTGSLIAFLKTADNDLTEAALSLVPETGLVLEALRACPGVLLARMSGSGSACFALFENEMDRMDAAEAITRAYPGWWVRGGWLNRVERY